MSIISRILKIFEAKTHSTIDKYEEPLEMSEQGIRDLKNTLIESLNSLAEIKSIVIMTNQNIKVTQNTINEYDEKAIQLLQKGQDGYLDQKEADRLASQALNKRNKYREEKNKLINENTKYENNLSKIEGKIDELKTKITSYENELRMLKSRQKTAAATKKINKQLSMLDTSGTIATIEKMKAKIIEDECLADAYQDIANSTDSIDSEIDSVIQENNDTSSLDELKRKMGIIE